MKFDFVEGEVILVDKPLEWTSFNVVKKVKHLFKIKKVGHAGTLDPLATGLLILCTGKKTKTIESIQDQQKEYTGIITLGKTTPSYDLETEFDGEFPTDHINEEKIQEAAKSLTGEIKQYPPIFSAVWVDGQRAYKLARNGKKVEVNPRFVKVDTFEIVEIDGNDVHFRIQCSKGTYIRTIAFDFGKILDSGAHLSRLRRTKIGDHNVDNAYSIDQLIEMRDEVRSQTATDTEENKPPNQ